MDHKVACSTHNSVLLAVSMLQAGGTLWNNIAPLCKVQAANETRPTAHALETATGIKSLSYYSHSIPLS
jgi:hypothetical protein